MLNSRIERKLLIIRIKSRMDNKLRPGALGPATLYKQMRVAGYDVTIEQVKDLLKQFDNAFPEMKFHMNAQKMSESEIAKYSYFKKEADDEDEEEEENAFVYTSTLLTGRKRNCCSYNAA